MKKIISAIFILVIPLYLAFSWLKSRPQFSEILDKDISSMSSIAPIDQAITLAKTIEDNVLLVVKSDSEGVHAVDLNRALSLNVYDSVAIYKELGTDKLKQIAYENPPEKYAWEDLGIPIRGKEWNIGVGSNYLLSDSSNKPFLLPKFSNPIPWNSAVAEGYRLDYEVELCMLPTSAAGDKIGLVLCNDYTDTWILLKNIDFSSKMGITGVSDAKAGESRLTLGPLLVIPNNNDFYEEIEIGLYLNGQLRQRSFASGMTWKPGKIIEESKVQCGEPFIYKNEVTSLYADCKNRPTDVLLMTGTPSGTLFDPVTVLNPWSYLREGDVVESYGTYLGVIRNYVNE